VLHLNWLWRDLRFGLRTLSKDSRFTSLAVLALALGIGATTVIFSAIDAILLEPYPYKNADRLTHFFIHDVTRPLEDGRGDFSVPEFMDFREQNNVFEDVIGYSGMDVLYSNGAGAEQFDGCWVTGNTFEFSGVMPLLGRWITPEDAKPDSPPVFMMSYPLWIRRFNRDPKIVGTTFTLNGTPTTLIGITPPRFLIGNRDIWMPISLTHDGVINSQIGFPLYLVARGRLKPGVSLKTAAADLDVIARRLSTIYEKDYPKQFTLLTKTLADWEVGDFKGTLYALLAAVLMLFLIACANVANLLLARATAREREIAIRASLGASRFQLVRQLLVESFILSVASCILGCFLAYFGLKAVVAVLPSIGVPPNAVIALNPRALLFAMGISTLTTLLCGLAPAIHAVRGELQSRLAGTGKGVSAGYRHGKLRGGLVIAEVALSILLLIGAGLMIRTLFALERVDLGFNSTNVLVVRLPFPKGRYDAADTKRLFFQQVLQRVTVLPGVVAATETASLPPYGGIESEITVPGKTHSESWKAQLQLSSEGYFQTLGRHLIRGRLLSETDVASARHVVVISQLLARNYFQQEDPIGKTIKFDLLDRVADAPHNAYFEIVGIVGDAKNQGVRDSPMPEAFAPYAITGAFNRGILVRTTADPLLMLASVRREIWAVDSNVALTMTGSLEDHLKRFSYAGPKFSLIVFSVFAGIGLVLVMIGVFSVMAYTVSLQTHEIGVRTALGAQQSDILRMVLKKGLGLIGTGIVIGVLASLGLTRFMASQVWGVSVLDRFTFAAVVIVVAVVGLAACIFPARRAAQGDPLTALRYE